MKSVTNESQLVQSHTPGAANAIKHTKERGRSTGEGRLRRDSNQNIDKVIRANVHQCGCLEWFQTVTQTEKKMVESSIFTGTVTHNHIVVMKKNVMIRLEIIP